jgi:hypothetical protein
MKNLKGRDHSEVIGVDEKIILKWILGKQDLGMLIWLRIANCGGIL